MRGLISFLPLVGIVLVLWLMVRPVTRRQKELVALQRALTVGDEIVLTSGIFGTITDLDDDTASVEVADGVVLRVARGAIGSVRTPPASTEPTEGLVTDEPKEN